jgi:5-methylcytosine-specific restriction endonuclease McrA
MAKDRIKEHAKKTLWKKSHNCALCGKTIDSIDKATLDHIVPRSLGGHTRLKNLQLAHMKCNSEKGSNLPYFSTDMMKSFEIIPSRLAKL